MTTQNYLIKGTVIFCGASKEDNKNVILLQITEAQASAITEKLQLKGEEDGISGNPIKIDEEKGSIAFKASSTFDVDIYKKGNEVTGEMELSEIGKDSEVEIFCSLKEVTFNKKKHYQVAYLKSINVTSLVPYEKFNAFDSELEAL